MKSIWHTRQKGLTLLELLATIAVLAVVAAIMMPVISNIIPDTRQRAVDQAQEQVDAFVSKWNDHGAYTYEPTSQRWTGYVDLNGDGVATSDEAIESVDLNEEQYQVEQSHGDAPQTISEVDFTTTPEDRFTIVGANPTVTILGPQYDPIVFTYLNTSFTRGTNNQQLIPALTGGAEDKTFSLAGTLPDGVSFDTATGVFTGPAASDWNFTISDISSGGTHTCAVTSDNLIKCWGSNAMGQLGTGTAGGYSSTPVSVPGITNAAAVVAADFHTCALTTQGAVKCWGENIFGNLGNGNTTQSATPVDVIGLSSGVLAISSGSRHTCALTNGGTMKCWGVNQDGGLGDGTTTNRSTPVTAGFSNVASMGLGGSSTCVVTNGGAVQCVGGNWAGQLGNGTTAQRQLSISTVTGLTSGVVQVAMGDSHACALTNSSTVKCWGRNGWGEVGDGTQTMRTTPVEVNLASTGVDAIFAGGWHTCATTSTGSLQCWGRNHRGQLGLGDVLDRSVATTVTAISNSATMVAVGVEHTCSISNDGGAQCWGSNGRPSGPPFFDPAQPDGRLGDGTDVSERLEPVNVELGPNGGAQPGFPSTVEVTVSDASGSKTMSITLTVD